MSDTSEPRSRPSVEQHTLFGRSVPCLGREPELARLAGEWSACLKESRARAVIVSGPSGVGKSRVGQEFLRRAGGRAMQVWLARGEAQRAGSPFSMAAQLLRRVCGLADGDSREQLWAKLRRRVSTLAPGDDVERLTHFLAELLGAPFANDASPQLRAARQNPMLMGDQMRRSWEDFVELECRRGPLLIVLEDVHYSDLSTVMLIEAALRRLKERPLLVLALARSDVFGLLPKLLSDPVEIRLGPLSPEAAAELVRLGLGATADEAQIERLVARFEGNAFYLEELMRAAGDDGGQAQPLPERLRSRLSSLPPDERAVLCAAAVLGEVFWDGGVGAITGVAADRRRHLLDALVERELIHPSPEARVTGDRELVFRHTLVQETALGLLAGDERARAHRAAGEWLLERGLGEPGVLAEHFERGGEPGRAVGFHGRAAEQALEGGDLAGALDHAGRALACGAGGETAASLFVLEGSVHEWRGNYAEADRCASQAAQLLARGSPAWCAAVGSRIVAAASAGEVDRLVELVGELPPLEPVDELEAAHVIAAARAAPELLKTGKKSLAQILLSQLDRARASQVAAQPTVAAWIENALAWRALFAGDISMSLHFDEASADSFARAGDLRNAAKQRAGAGFEKMLLGRYAEAEAALREALASAERMGLDSLSAMAKQNLGLVLGYLSRFDEAFAVERQSLDEFLALGDPRNVSASRIYLARVLDLSNRIDEAAAEAELALEGLEAFPAVRADALAVLARVRLKQRRLDDALELAAHAATLLATTGSESLKDLVRLTHAQALAAVGKLEAARTAIALARDELVTAAQRISDGVLRQSFLRAVPENARILDLAEHWAPRST